MKPENNNKLDKWIDEGLRLSPYHHFDVDQEFSSFMSKINVVKKPEVEKTEDKKPSTKLFLISFLRYAAVILPVIGVFYLISRPVTFVETKVTQNFKDSITLFDGSVIVMDENTVLTYPVRKEGVVNRRIVLEKGSATFNVVPNAELPFIVSAYPLETTVTGTVFTVQKNGNLVGVTIKEGSVKVVKKSEKAPPVIIKKGDEIQIKKGEFFKKDSTGNIVQITHYTYESRLVLEKIELAKKAEAERLASLKTTEKGIKIAGSTYRLIDVIDFIDKKFKKQLKFKKKRRLVKDAKVMIDLNANLPVILSELQAQKMIVFEKGKCENCYIISALKKQ